MFDDKRDVSYSYFHDFGEGNETFVLKGPAEAPGRVTEVTVAATETFNQVSTQGRVKLGIADNPDEFVDMELGALSDNDVMLASRQSDIIDPSVPADTAILVTLTGPTGGTPAGKAMVTISMRWFL